MSIHFFELQKVAEKLDTNDKKSLWMQLIKADTEEELDMIKNTNIPEMQQAVQVIFDMSADTVMRERARLREKALFDEVSAMEGARAEGKVEGIAEGRAEGKVEGYLEALVEFVGDGILTLADAAKKANMTVQEFEAKTGLKA